MSGSELNEGCMGPTTTTNPKGYEQQRLTAVRGERINVSGGRQRKRGDVDELEN